jgi:putative ABC transport system substrate-binding protein
MTFRWAALIVAFALVIMPPTADAQSAARIPRIGILSPAPAAAAAGSPFDAFREALRELGYVDGKNIILEFRFAGGYSRLAELATDLVRLQVDVIVTDGGDTVAQTVLKMTKTIPIVMGTTSSDPVASGLVASLARPGGNVTGFVLSYNELAGKRLQLLKEMIPAATRVGVLWDQTSSLPQFRAAEAAAPSLGMQLVSLPVRRSTDLDAAFEEASRQRAGALLQMASRMLFDNRKAIVERALKHRLPGVFELGFEETGALASYGPSVSDNFRRAAVYVDKILKGARPGDLPVEQPAKFHLGINLRTARALGVTIPPSVLLQATKIIE